MTSLCLVLAFTAPSTFAFDRIERAHMRMDTAEFRATYGLSGAGGTANATFNVRYRWPQEFRLQSIDTSGRLVYDRCIEPKRVIDYDPKLKQYISKTRRDKGTAGEVLAKMDENLDDVILAFTGGKAFKVWLSPMASESPWTLAKKGDQSVLSFIRDKRKIELRVDWTTARLERVDIKTDTQRLTWDFSYASTVGPLAFAPPSGATEVPTFDRSMKPPTYKDATARKVAEKMFAAYSDLSAIGYRVLRDQETTTVQVRGRFARQEDAAAIWTFDGRTLTLFEKKTGQWFRGEMDFVDVIDLVANHGTRVDPTLQLVLRGFNPYRRRLGDGATVSVVGAMKLDGTPVTMLAAKSENATITLFVRDSDGRVVGSSTKANEIDATDGAMVDLRFEYFAVPNDLAARSKLNVPQGKKPIKLVPAKPL